MLMRLELAAKTHFGELKLCWVLKFEELKLC